MPFFEASLFWTGISLKAAAVYLNFPRLQNDKIGGCGGRGKYVNLSVLFCEHRCILMFNGQESGLLFLSFLNKNVILKCSLFIVH